MSNDKSLVVYVVISQKNLSCTIFDKKTDKKQNERKSWELTVCTAAAPAYDDVVGSALDALLHTVTILSNCKLSW